MEPPQISFFAYYMWAPLDRFLCILFRGPLRSASVLTIGGPLRLFVCILLLHVYGALSNQFLCILYRAPPPQISFIAYYIGAPQADFSHIIWGPAQVSFCAYYMGPPQVSFFAYYRPRPPQISFFAYYMGSGPLKSVSSLTIWVLLKPVSSLTMWGPHRSYFFAYYMGASLRSVSSLIIRIRSDYFQICPKKFFFTFL